MISLCSVNNVAREESCVMQRFDLNDDGEVQTSELANINISSIHKNIYGNESIYKNNKFFKHIDEDNLKTALDRNKDDVINIDDFNLISQYDEIQENIFSLIELIALNDAFGEYKDGIREKCGGDAIYRDKYVQLAELQLAERTIYDELFVTNKISSPIPTGLYNF